MKSTERDGAYAPLEAPDILPLLSLLCFSGALAARPLVRLLPRDWRLYPWGLAAPALLATGFALVGLLLALVSRHRASRRGLARVGVLLNGIVLALSALAAAGVFWILRR
jgi:hypothetical protein